MCNQTMTARQHNAMAIFYVYQRHLCWRQMRLENPGILRCLWKRSNANKFAFRNSHNSHWHQRALICDSIQHNQIWRRDAGVCSHFCLVNWRQHLKILNIVSGFNHIPRLMKKKKQLRIWGQEIVIWVRRANDDNLTQIQSIFVSRVDDRRNVTMIFFLPWVFNNLTT